MAWTTPRTWTTGELFTAAIGNTHIRDNLNYLFSSASLIVQVVSATYATQTASSSSTHADTGLTVAITPADNTNKVLVLVAQNGCSKDTGDTGLALKLLRGATLLADLGIEAGRTQGTVRNDFGAIAGMYLDSPASASALTYKTTFASSQNNAQVIVQRDSTMSTIAALEVAAS